MIYWLSKRENPMFSLGHVRIVQLMPPDQQVVRKLQVCFQLQNSDLQLSRQTPHETLLPSSFFHTQAGTCMLELNQQRGRFRHVHILWLSEEGNVFLPGGSLHLRKVV